MLADTVKTKRNYLIVAPSWVGDMVMSHTLVQTIKLKYPEASIDLLAPKSSLPLTTAMPEVHEGIELPFAHGELNLFGRHQLAKKLKLRDYTHAIILPNSFKSALIPWWAKIPVRTGWRGEYRYTLLTDLRALDKKKFPLMIQRFMALGLDKNETLEKLIQPRLVIPPDRLEKTISQFSINMDRSAPFILAPGAEYGEAKRWPASYFAELARKLTNSGYPVWFLGSHNDKPLIPTLMFKQNDLCRNLIGKTSLAEAIALISLARFVVSNDSGLMHIAAALDKPLLALFGSSDTAFTPPLSDKAKTISLDLPCRPCFKRTCPLGHLDCLNKLEPKKIFKETMEWIKKCEY